MFRLDEPDDDDEIRGESEADKIRRIKEEKEESERAKKWNWFVFIYSLTKGDITKRDQILKMNFISVLNWKSFEVENKHIKQYYENRNT